MLRVSILIVTKNRSPLLIHCLHSLKKTSGHNWEVVIVDNASVDDTKKVANKFAQFYRYDIFTQSPLDIPKFIILE